MAQTLTIEIDSDRTARLRLTGYTVYAHVAPVDEGWKITLDDHLTGNATKLISQTEWPKVVFEEARDALLERARADGVDIDIETVKTKSDPH